MAIISIPTSIGGITIPGLNKGPLGSLFGNPFKTDSYQYPSDLGSSNKNHIIRFDIKEIKSAKIDLPNFSTNVTLPQTWSEAGAMISDGASSLGSTIGDSISQLPSTLNGVASDFANGASKAITVIAGIQPSDIFNGIGNAKDSVVNGVKDYSQTTFTQDIQPGVTETKATIQLYMPDSMDFQLSIDYDGSTTAATAAESLPLIGGAIQSLNNAAKNSAVQLALKKFGYALNPQLQLIFQGVGFREYSMSFVFSPNSSEEAETIKQIIKLFRGYSSPQLIKSTKGMFYRPPAVFDISFLSNGKQNTKINKIKQSVIKSVDVNYAPNGWAAHADGSPVQTTMTLQLQENVLIDRDEIFNNGY